MKYIALSLAVGLVASPANAQDMSAHGHHGADHDAHTGHDHTAMTQETHTTPQGVPLSQTAEIKAALAGGGEPVVVDVLGVVCDFCAKAMNKTFGKRGEVAAVYVDLDSKTLNLVMKAGQTLSDSQIDKLVEKAGYKLAAIRRGARALNAGR